MIASSFLYLRGREGKSVALAEDSSALFCIPVELEVFPEMRTPMVLNVLQLVEVEQHRGKNVCPHEGFLAVVTAIETCEAQYPEFAQVLFWHIAEVEEHVH